MKAASDECCSNLSTSAKRLASVEGGRFGDWNLVWLRHYILGCQVTKIALFYMHYAAGFHGLYCISSTGICSETAF